MPPVPSLDFLAPIPDPAEVQRRLAEAAVAQRLLRRLLQLALEAQRERDERRVEHEQGVTHV